MKLYNPFKRIKEILALNEKQFKKITELEADLEAYKGKEDISTTRAIGMYNTIKELNKDRESPSAVIEAVMRRGIVWYDYTELQKDKQAIYYKDAQEFLKNETIMNERKHFINDLVQEIAMSSENFEDVRDLRMTINGIETFFERLDDILDPSEPPKTEKTSQDMIDDLQQL